MATRLYKMLISALVAGLLTGLISYNGGAAWRFAAIAGVVSALKDVQAYLSTAPGATQ